jgi:ferredoxin
MSINIELGNCVRVFSKNSECSKCADICSDNSITFIDNIPQVASNGTDLLSLGVCPTGAISIKDKDPLEFAFKFLEEESASLVCGENVPCNGIWHVEHIISMMLLKSEVKLDFCCCQECKEVVQTKIDEANFFIEKLGVEKTVECITKEEIDEAGQETPNRRDFLRRLSIKGAVKSKIEFDKEVEKLDHTKISSNDSANIRQKSIPDRRKFLYMALKRVDKLEEFEIVEQSDLSFISQKIIDDSCDNCSICYRVCPTGALQSDRRNTKIEFDALSCVKCHLCHDVCVSDSISISNFDMKNIFEPKIVKLIEFNVVRCNDCGNFFTHQGGEPTCKRCKLEEEEAKELWGIQ